MKIGLIGLLGLMMLASGCALFDRAKGKPDLEVHPSGRSAEVWGYINEAQELTGLKRRRPVEWHFIAATHYPGGKPAIVLPDGGGRLAGGWTTDNGKRSKTLVAMGRDGKLGPKTGLWEAGRVLCFQHGIISEAEQTAFLIGKGLWK